AAEAELLRARGKGTVERSYRVDWLLRQQDAGRPAAERRRTLHVIRLVEQAGTRESCELLSELTRSDRPLIVQTQAAAALKRLRPKGTPAPRERQIDLPPKAAPRVQ